MDTNVMDEMEKIETLSLVYTYYDNPGTLQRVVSHLNSYDPQIRQRIELIVVDDGSPRFPANSVELFPSVSMRIFRVSKNKPWNHRAARNIGAHEARSPWLLLLDIDTEVPGETIQNLFKLEVLWTDWFLFSRKNLQTGLSLPRHHDTFLMSRKLYWQVGGFDENYCGIYGTGPTFAKEVSRKFPWTHLDNLDVHIVSRLDCPDSYTHEFKRKATIAQRIKAHGIRVGRATGILPRKTLSNPYLKVSG
jgi:glycosyltransferase involved in cell wall biosynthesis